MDAARADISYIHKNSPRKLSLNSHVPYKGLRVMQVLRDRRYRCEWIWTGRHIRQRTGRIGKTSASDRSASSRDPYRVWRRGDCVTQDVVEIDVVVHGKPTANDRLIFPKQAFAKLRRV